ncbi:T9SS type A sorting domain-containing protein, partial [Bacteroidota bacterium]
MKALGTVWEGGPHAGESFSIDTDASHTMAYAPQDTSETVDDTDFMSEFDWEVVQMVRDSGGMDNIGYGLYKVYLDQANHTEYFYIDFRDTNYCANVYSNCDIECNDTWFKYNVGVEQFSYVNYGLDAKLNRNWTAIDSMEILYIWEIKNQSAPVTSGFPSFWTKCLYILDDYDNPRLTWGKHPSFSTTHYKIYVASSSTPVLLPASLNYSLVATVDSDTYEYIDTAVRFGEIDYIYYYVKAYNSSSQTYSGASNIVEIRGEFWKKAKLYQAPDKLTYNLQQNHPNPFNPTTNISYSIISKSNVKLRVFNSLGQEIEILVNEIQGGGNYTIPFDAGNLPSGIYFYQLITDHFTDVKKM